jgi:hypothetical protein
MFKVFKDIEFKVNYEELYKRLKIRKRERFADKINSLVEESRDIVKPKGIYKVAYIDEKGEDFIIVDGVKLSSKILRKNVDKVNKVFVFLVTCGEEVADWASNKTDLLDDFIADAIQEYACRLASNVLITEIDNKYKLENPSTMNPGSLGDWPIEQQKPLFEILEGKNKDISTTLTDSFLMQPTKSVSGIRFSSDVAFCNCEMCPRENCPTRMADYVEPMY